MLMIVILQLFLVATASAWPGASEASEACATPGALRAEPTGGLSVCLSHRGSRQHAWTALGEDRAPVASTRGAPVCTDLVGQLACDTTCSINGVCLGADQWLEVQDCRDRDQVCVNGACISRPPEFECPSIPVRCIDPGFYPYIEDCSRYYECGSNGVGTVKNCPDGLFYDACFQKCVISAHEPCRWVNHNPCPSAGVVGVAPNNDRLSYICVLDATNNIYELWRQCEVGHFNAVSGKCEREYEPGCGSNTGCEGVDQGSEASTSTPKPTGPFSCPGKGFYPNPVTDCSFYSCNSGGISTLIRCASGYHYDASLESCVSGACTPV